MPVGAQGGSFRLYSIPEVTENTLPGGNWDQLPCFTFGMGADQELSQDQILSANPNRDAADPYYGKIAVQGDTRVPVDTVHFGKWLKLLLGAPTTTGTGNYTHVFKSGSGTLPSRSFEKAFTDIARYEQYGGVRANTLAVTIDDGGAADATIGLLGMQEIIGGSSAAGTPTRTGFTRFQRPTGTITKDGSTLAAVTGGNMNYTNDMQLVNDTVRADLMAEGVDLGQSAGTGQVQLRFKDHTLVSAAIAGTPCDLRYSMTIDANTSIEFRYPRAFLQRKGRPVDGPRGVSMTVPFIAAYDSTLQCLFQVTLKNQTASYASF